MMPNCEVCKRRPSRRHVRPYMCDPCVKEHGVQCPHCIDLVPSTWDSGLECFAHVDRENPGKLLMCWTPWAKREKIE